MTTPVPLALIVCDSVFVESSTRKTALIGLFNNIFAAKFPATHHRLCVYASVTEVRPKTQFKLEIVNAESEQIVITLQGPPPDKVTPLMVCDLQFELKNLVFPEPGLYFIRFWGDDKLIVQRPLEVKEVAQKREEQA